jgi:cytochrome c oxidase accessory protein FixG
VSSKNKEDQSFYRDKLTTVSNEGKRVWVYPKKPKGRYTNYRRLLAYFLLVVFFIMPFIKLKGEPFLLLNILERKFIIFGVIFWPHDFYIIVLSIISLLVFIILFTVVFGRLFCGWVCPQTIFMEMVFRRIEYWIEGDYNAQKKLNREEWNFTKIWKKTLKHLIFYLIAFLIANTFLAYLIGIEELKVLVTDGPIAHLSSFIALLIFSGVFYFIFAFFREQVCTIACPYGRLQGVLLDDKSIVVAYDYNRGEPRGKHNPLMDKAARTSGDCIDCSSCVTVCPTNIDIRNGTQLECINCTACMDACDAVMDRLKKPKGLIRYASEKSIDEKVKQSIFNPRAIAYSVFLTILLVVVGVLFIARADFETTIFRQSGTMFQKYNENSYSNIYQIEVVNKTRTNRMVEVRLLQPEGRIIMMGDPIVAEKGKVGSGSFLVVLDNSILTSSKIDLKFGVYSANELIQEYDVTFVAPRNLE